MKKLIKVNDNPLEWEENMTINTVLTKMKYSFKMLVVKVNGELVKKSEFGNFIIPEEADVKIIHLISGG